MHNHIHEKPIPLLIHHVIITWMAMTHRVICLVISFMSSQEYGSIPLATSGPAMIPTTSATTISHHNERMLYYLILLLNNGSLTCFGYKQSFFYKYGHVSKNDDEAADNGNSNGELGEFTWYQFDSHMDDSRGCMPMYLDLMWERGMTGMYNTTAKEAKK